METRDAGADGLSRCLSSTSSPNEAMKEAQADHNNDVNPSTLCAHACGGVTCGGIPAKW